MWEKGYLSLALGTCGNVLRFIRLLHGVDMENMFLWNRLWSGKLTCQKSLFFLSKYQHFVADSWFLFFCGESVELRIWIDPFTNTVVALLVVMSIRKGLVQKHCVFFTLAEQWQLSAALCRCTCRNPNQCIGGCMNVVIELNSFGYSYLSFKTVWGIFMVSIKKLFIPALYIFPTMKGDDCGWIWPWYYLRQGFLRKSN